MTDIDKAIIKCAARLACEAIYDPVDEKAFIKLHRVGESVCGIAERDGICYIVMQGTELKEAENGHPLHFSLDGWVADLDCLPILHPVLGHLHGGFYQNLPLLMTIIQAELAHDASIVVTGHSKGAAESVQLGALLKLAGFNVGAMVLFACPRPGYQELANWLTANIPGISYRNAPGGAETFGDPVAMIPFAPYVAPYPLFHIDRAPAGFERIMSVQWHRAQLYMEAIGLILG